MQFFEAIQLCKQGNHAAQKYLFELYAEPMYTLCYRYVRNREDAEELMLNGFFRFFKSMDRFRENGENSAAPWLRKIMVNECLMFLRKNKKLSMVAGMEEPEIPVDEDIIARISAEELYRLILELPPGYRTIFNLFVLEGLSHAEIARELNITVGTSKSQLSKARGLLQSLVTQNNKVYTDKK